MEVAAKRGVHVRPLALLREVCYDFPEIWLKEGGGGGGGGGQGGRKLMFTQGTITQGRGRGYEAVEFTRINKQKDTPPPQKKKKKKPV